MKGKRVFYLVFFLLYLCLIIKPEAGISKDNSPGERDASEGDSISLLDSLVNFNKVINNALSIKYANLALTTARRSNSAENLVDAYIMLGIAYFQNQKDSSFYYYNAAAKIAEESHLEKRKIIILYNLAALYNYSSNYKDAIKYLDSSIRLAQLTHDHPGISNGLNMLGVIKTKIQDYESAKLHFASALKVGREHLLYHQMGAALGSSGRLVFEIDSNKAVSMLREALFYLQKAKGTEEEMANILINLGYLYSNPDSALFYYNAALVLAENAQLPRIIMGAYNNMAYSYLEKKDFSKAESCVRDHAIPVAIKARDHDWLSSLYDTYADVCIDQGNIKMALSMQKKALKERKLDYQQKAAEQVRLLAAQFDLQNKELTIQNEEKKLLVQRNQLQKTELWLAITAFLVIISVLFMLFLQHRNRVRFHKEKIESARRIIEMEESEKGRTSRELHDLTGQLVLGISGMIENIEFSEPDIKVLINERIKDLGTSIRHISHRMNRAMIEHFTFSELITGLCKDVQKLTGLKITHEIPEELPELPNDLVLHFYRIIQELLTNASKYAKQSPINIIISCQNNELSMLYMDHGPGFSLKEKGKNGMGIINIFERVKLVNGKATVKSDPGIGTRWEFFFPIDAKKVIKQII